MSERAAPERGGPADGAEAHWPFKERRVMPATQSPRHPDFVAVVLEPLAARRRAGEADAQLSLDLYNSLHTWALAFAGAQCGRLPAHADRNEVLSQVLKLTWEACTRIDWDQYAAWPAYLESKLSRARIEAARSEDWISRRERTRRRAFQEELARREQQQGRSITATERRQIALDVAPRSTRVDWTKTLLDARHPSTVADVPDVVEVANVEDEVEGIAIGRIRSACLTKWLMIVAAQNEALVADLTKWSSLNEFGDRPLPARLARRLEPYTPLLLAMLGEAA